MSFINITIRRWGIIIVCGFLTAVLIEVLSQVKWVTDITAWWLTIFSSLETIPQRIFLSILGIFLYLFLLKINVYSKKASFRNWLFYPPSTFLVLPAIPSFIWLSDTLTFHAVFLFLPSEQALNLYYLMACLFIMNIFHFYTASIRGSSAEVKHNQSAITSKSTYKDYQNWFSDDSPISNIQQLSTDLQHYAKRMAARIQNDKDHYKSMHISLCGNFGSGKSSIIKCIAKELGTDFIYSNIDTWGTDTKSINAFVLKKVVEDVAQYVDMSEFKNLPYQYIEALKLGNNTFKLLAIFSVVSMDPIQSLKKLNSVLGAINKKLLITIQDIDRCLEPKKTTDELAALLDKLKGLNNISFIIALGYKNELSESIRKVCDYREDIIKTDKSLILLNFISVLNQRATDSGFVISDITIKNMLINLKAHNNPYEIISSERSFKNICRRIDSIWQKDKLMGEIDLESLCLLIVLREELPLIFENLIKNKDKLLHEIETLKRNNQANNSSDENNKITPVLLNEFAGYYPSIMNVDKIKAYLTYVFECNNILGQGALYKHSMHQYCNYLDRILLESVPSIEVKDQDVINLFRTINEKGAIEILISNLKNNDNGLNWVEAYIRFSAIYFNPTNLVIYESMYIQMIDYYYEDTVEYIKDRKITLPNTLSFLILLLDKCLACENVLKLFEVTLKIPEILTAPVSAYSSRPDIYQYLDLFLENDQSKKLYPFLIAQFKENNNLIDKLVNVNSSFQALSRFIAFMGKKEHQVENAKELYLWKDIILAFIEKNNKGENAYQFGLFFICYIIKIEDPLEEVFSSDELLLIRTELQQLQRNTIKIYLGNEQKSIEDNHQKILARLDVLEVDKVVDS